MMKMVIGKKKILTFSGVVIFVFGLIFYYFVDPATFKVMPQCMFHALTGYDCPSCGTQRALHCLLHGEIQRAVSYNPFLFISLPYLAVVVWGSIASLPKSRQMRRIFHSRIAVLSYVVLVLAWWIIRNLS